jgi:hypothetical protein
MLAPCCVHRAIIFGVVACEHIWVAMAVGAGAQNRFGLSTWASLLCADSGLAPVMVSTPDHRACRRRQRGALPAWLLCYSGFN